MIRKNGTKEINGCASLLGDGGRTPPHYRLLQFCVPWPSERKGQRSDANLSPGGAQAGQSAADRQHAAQLQRLCTRKRLHKAKSRPYRSIIWQHQDPEPRRGHSNHVYKHHQVSAYGEGVTTLLVMWRSGAKLLSTLLLLSVEHREAETSRSNGTPELSWIQDAFATLTSFKAKGVCEMSGWNCPESACNRSLWNQGQTWSNDAHPIV